MWQANINNKGYGMVWVLSEGCQRLAHRVSMSMHLGRDLGRSELVLHHCDNPLCVRPDHLFLGTQLDNMRDMHSKGRGSKWRPKRIDKCHKGHAFTPENTYNRKDIPEGTSQKQCKACRTIAAKQFRDRRKQEKINGHDRVL